eukprot:scaffold3.g6329.t1
MTSRQKRSPLERVGVLAGHLVAPDSAEGDDAGLARQPTRAAEALPTAGTTPEFQFAQNMTSFPPARSDALLLDELLTPEERELGKLALGGANLQGYGCPGYSIMGCAMACIELARVDGSMSTFMLVHGFLATLTVGLLGSEEQKRELLPDMARFQKVGCWALTEPSNGSDASAITTTARKVPGGWLLNGRKRWIGNGTWCDVAVIWARSAESGQVNAFLVRKGNPGYRATKIENKIALRCVQNADITLTDCFVPDADRLPGVNSFADTNKVLAISRVMVAWQPVGLAMGAYDMAARYVTQRRQFGAPLAAFQLVQEKLQRMQATVQAMFLMAWRLTQVAEGGRLTHEQASLVKGWNTLRAREVVGLGRELLGGNGILADFLVAKAFCDAEAYYSYEGTYEVNALVAGRGATGISAIKPPPARAQREAVAGRVQA